MGSHRADRREQPVHGHGHGHGPSGDGDVDVAPLPRAMLLAVLAAAAVATLVGLAWLWPDGDAARELKGSVGFTAEGATFPEASVARVLPACPPSSEGGPVPSADPCGTVEAVLTEGQDEGLRVSVDVPPQVSHAGLNEGDRVVLIRTPGAPGQAATFGYYEIERSGPLWVVGVLFVVVVLAVARVRGLMAMLGLGFAGVVVGGFALPALLTGEPPVPVALVAASLIMFVVLYTTHGVSLRTSAALAGTLAGMVLTAAIGWYAVTSAQLTGVVDEGGQVLTAFAADVRLQDLLVAAVIIAGLGVLNDVTITQASAVWELRGVAPGMGRRRLFASAMRIGRDHIASTIYTIVFAYAGTALTLLLAVSLQDRSWLGLLGTEEISEEIVRSFVSSIGLVLAVPATTAIAVLTVPGPRESQPQAQPQIQ